MPGKFAIFVQTQQTFNLKFLAFEFMFHVHIFYFYKLELEVHAQTLLKLYKNIRKCTSLIRFRLNPRKSSFTLSRHMAASPSPFFIFLLPACLFVGTFCNVGFIFP
jgi:hypothetical protein